MSAWYSWLIMLFKTYIFVIIFCLVVLPNWKWGIDVYSYYCWMVCFPLHLCQVLLHLSVRCCQMHTCIITASFWWIDTFTIISGYIFAILKSILSNISTATPAFIQLLFAWIFLPSFYFQCLYPCISSVSLKAACLYPIYFLSSLKTSAFWLDCLICLHLMSFLI